MLKVMRSGGIANVEVLMESSCLADENALFRSEL